MLQSEQSGFYLALASLDRLSDVEVEEAAGAGLNKPVKVLLEVVAVSVHDASVHVMCLAGDNVETLFVKVLFSIGDVELSGHVLEAPLARLALGHIIIVFDCHDEALVLVLGGTSLGKEYALAIVANADLYVFVRCILAVIERHNVALFLQKRATLLDDGLLDRVGFDRLQVFLTFLVIFKVLEHVDLHDADALGSKKHLLFSVTYLTHIVTLTSEALRVDTTVELRIRAYRHRYDGRVQVLVNAVADRLRILNLCANIKHEEVSAGVTNEVAVVQVKLELEVKFIEVVIVILKEMIHVDRLLIFEVEIVVS